MREMVQYIKRWRIETSSIDHEKYHSYNETIGVMVVVKGGDGTVGLGWSLRHPIDSYDHIGRPIKFDKNKALKIAYGRARTTNREMKIPNSIMKDIEKFALRAGRYFKHESITIG